MEINLYCWISNNDNFFSYSNVIRKVVFKALADAGYDIPVPQQDVNITKDNVSLPK
jgi:small-conductance mechanosensitive channel